MNKLIKVFFTALKIWIAALVPIILAVLSSLLLHDSREPLIKTVVISFGGTAAAVPALIALTILLFILNPSSRSPDKKYNIILKAAAACCALYAVPGGFVYSQIYGNTDIYGFFVFCLIFFAITVAAVFGSLYIFRPNIDAFFSSTHHSSQKQFYKMETTHESVIADKQSSSSTRILTKGIITGVLILLLLIPTVFINNLVQERKMRHQEIATEVSSRWSSSQTLNGPYLFVPYKTFVTKTDGKIEELNHHYWLLPEQLNVIGNMDDDADDTGKWGLAGLLGLLGLLGLRKRDNDARYTSTTTSPRRND